MTEATLYVPNAIIFIFDLSNKDVQVPVYEDDAVVLSNNTCISVATIADVDGEATIELSRKVPNSDRSRYENVFMGSIETPGLSISVVTSQLEEVLSVEADEQQTNISIWVDNPSYPSEILVVVS